MDGMTAPAVSSPLPLGDLEAMDRLARAAMEAKQAYWATRTKAERAVARQRWSVALMEFEAFCTPSRVAQLVAAARLLPEFVDEDDCRYDHHGYCQAHNLHERPCPHERAKALLAARASRPTEET